MKRYPTWAVPTLASALPNPASARARLGAQAQHAQRTEEERRDNSRRLHRDWMKATTPEDRKRWARAAGIKGAAGKMAKTTPAQRRLAIQKGWETRRKRYTPEEIRDKQRAAQLKAVKARMENSTQERRTEIARKAGVASAVHRAAKRAQRIEAGS